MQVGSSVSKVDVHLSVNKNPSVSENHNTEVTVFAKNHVIRATDTRCVTRQEACDTAERSGLDLYT